MSCLHLEHKSPGPPLPLAGADAKVVIVTLPRTVARWAIRAYQLTLSGLVGRQCRHIPTCSSYADEAVARFGLWAGGWMAFARLCRCHPWGTSGLDPVPTAIDRNARWYAPWRYGHWSATTPPTPPE